VAQLSGTVALALILTSLSRSAVAQDGRPPEGRPGDGGDVLQRHIDQSRASTTARRADTLREGDRAVQAARDAALEARRLAGGPDYLAVVQQYAVGNRAAAVALMAGGPQGFLTLDVDRMVRIASDARLLAFVRRYAGDPEGAKPQLEKWRNEVLRRDALDMLTLGPDWRVWDERGTWAKAALMLHTDAAEMFLDNARSPAEQLLAATRAAAFLDQHSELKPYLSRWYLALASAAHARAWWDDARNWAERGLKAFDQDVELRLVVATVEEVRASLTAAPLPEAAYDEPGAARQALQAAPSGESRQHLIRARKALLAARTLQPQRTDVRLRLGRIQARLGERAEARELFQEVLAAAPAPEKYLAHVFLAQLEDAEGRLEDAAREYSAAVELVPRSQPAHLGRSNVLLRLGDFEAARRDAEVALAPAAANAAPTSAAAPGELDPFWLYPWGDSMSYKNLLAVLRSEVLS